MKYIIGSKLLGLTKNRDIDYVEIIEGDKTTHNFNCGREDIIQISKEFIEQYMNFEIGFKKHEDTSEYLVLYQYDADIIKQDFPIEYHLLDHKDKFVELLKHIREKRKYNLIEGGLIGSDKMNKFQYHIAYIVFILQNNSVLLTEEQHNIIQKIHDRQMPIEYVNTLIGYIDEL